MSYHRLPRSGLVQCRLSRPRNSRHTHGTLLHSQGTPLKVAQAQLGHSHMATTLEIYTHASGSAQRDAVNLLEEQLFPNVPKLENSGTIAEKESHPVQSFSGPAARTLT